MSRTLILLTTAGRHGPLLLCLGVLTGLFFPWLADAMRPLMGVAVFVFTLGAFLKVDREAFSRESKSKVRLVAVVAWVTVGVPVAAFTIVKLTSFSTELDLGIILATLAPPVGSAAAIAAMLGLSPSLALIATVAATILAPIYLPPLAQLMASADLEIDQVGMAVRLAVIVGGAGTFSWLLRRYAEGWVKNNPHAMTGISVVGLLVVAIGAMRGMDAQLQAAPLRAAQVLILAFALNVFLQALGAALFLKLGAIQSLTVGLVSGNRNITLVWAAAGPFLTTHPEIELLLAMSVFPIFMLPLITKALLSWTVPYASVAPPVPEVGRAPIQP